MTDQPRDLAKEAEIDTVEAIRQTVAELKQYWAGNPGDVPYNLTRYFEHCDILLERIEQQASRIQILHRHITSIEESHRLELKDMRAELRETAAETRWQERQGEDYGSY